MTNKQFKARLVMIDLNQTSFASAIGTTPRTVSTWINTTSIPKVVLLALDALEYKYNNDIPR